MDQNDLYYVPGDFNLICDVCCKKIKASESRLRWDGLRVCKLDWEERQPQDFVKARADKITVPFTRPRPTDVFTFTCDLFTSSGVANVGVADCAQADNDTFYTEFNNGLMYNYQDWQKQWCDPTTRTAISGVGYTGCCTSGYNIQGYL